MEVLDLKKKHNESSLFKKLYWAPKQAYFEIVKKKIHTEENSSVPSVGCALLIFLLFMYFIIEYTISENLLCM